MIVSELIAKLQTLPQDATVFKTGGDYPESINGVIKLTKKKLDDGYHYPHHGTNKNVVIEIW